MGSIFCCQVQYEDKVLLGNIELASAGITSLYHWSLYFGIHCQVAVTVVTYLMKWSFDYFGLKFTCLNSIIQNIIKGSNLNTILY